MFKVETHGTSGTWHEGSEHETLFAAHKAAKKSKEDGYGVRILDESGVIASAPWQEELLRYYQIWTIYNVLRGELTIVRPPVGMGKS